MARQTIQLGTTPNDGTGTPLRTAGGYINDNFTEVYAAKETVTVTPASDADVTLTATENLYGRIELATGSWTSAHNVVVSLTQRSFTFANNSAYAATVKTSAGTGVAVPAGQSARLYCDGTGVVVANANGRFATIIDNAGTGAPEATNGLKIFGENMTPHTGFKSIIINGKFDIWQAGTSFIANNEYTADMWVKYNASATNITANRVELTTTEKLLTGCKYGIELTQAAGAIGGRLDNRVELDNTDLVGKTVTISFYAKSSAASNFTYVIAGNATSPVVGLTTELARYSVTLTISDSGQTYTPFGFRLPDSSELTYTITGVQVEYGTVSTPLEQRQVPLELLMCQRYYEVGAVYRSGVIENTSAGVESCQFKVQKRALPTIAVLSTSGFINFTGVAIGTVVNTGEFPHYPTGGTTNTQGRYYFTYSASARL